MKKNIFKIITISLIIIICTGCFKSDKMEDINITTTVYPLEYIITELYGDNSVINSIYPDGINTTNYKFTDKEIKDYSQKDLFIYNGLSSDKDIALKLLNKNKNLLIMDSNYGMEYQYGIEELWLNPSNLLMISQNIKNGLEELIESKIIKEDINEKYENLKVELSELDAEIKTIHKNSSKKKIVVASPSLMYLEKYGFEAILINDEDSNKNNIDTAISLANNKEIAYIFILENDKESTALKKIKKETKVKTLTIDKLDNMNDEERDNKENYITLMKKNIEILKKGTE